MYMNQDVNPQKKLLIEGVNQAGQKLRPSDWAERVCGHLSSFENQRICYSPLLQPITKNGYSCVLVDPELSVTNPEAYEMVLAFALENELRIKEA
jgi:hypothetical protein